VRDRLGSGAITLGVIHSYMRVVQAHALRQGSSSKELPFSSFSHSLRSASLTSISSQICSSHLFFYIMEVQHLTGVSHTLQTLAFASIIITVLWYLPRFNLKAQLRKLPPYIYEDGSNKSTTYLTSAKRLYVDGYQKVRFDFRSSSSRFAYEILVQKQCLAYCDERR
jgi:hypothetical protein